MENFLCLDFLYVHQTGKMLNSTKLHDPNILFHFMTPTCKNILHRHRQLAHQDLPGNAEKDGDEVHLVIADCRHRL